MIQISKIKVEISKEVYQALKAKETLTDKIDVLKDAIDRAESTDVNNLASTWLMDKSKILSIKLLKKEKEVKSSNPLIKEYTKSWFVRITKLNQ